MTITDKELKRLANRFADDDLDLTPNEALRIVTELRAARKVVRAVKQTMADPYGNGDKLEASLAAYDKARKGKVTK